MSYYNLFNNKYRSRVDDVKDVSNRSWSCVLRLCLVMEVLFREVIKFRKVQKVTETVEVERAWGETNFCWKGFTKDVMAMKIGWFPK